MNTPDDEGVLISLKTYFGNEDKIRNFIKEILDMFGGCMEKIYCTPYEIIYRY